jgi:hypothetical protein
MAQKDPKKKMPLMAANAISNHVFGKAGSSEVAPFEGPFCFLFYTWYSFDCSQMVRLLSRILDVHVDQKQVRFTVDVFDGNLEAVETSSFR